MQQAPGRWPSVHVPGTAHAGVPAPAQGSPGRSVYKHSGKLYAKGLGRCSECPRAAAGSAQHKNHLSLLASRSKAHAPVNMSAHMRVSRPHSSQALQDFACTEVWQVQNIYTAWEYVMHKRHSHVVHMHKR